MSHSTLSPSPDAVLDPEADFVATDNRATTDMLLRYLALFAAWIATCGSLFFSLVLGWQPCTLCWYQRILMYPIGIVLLMGLLRRDSRVYTYVLPLSLIGATTSLYHYALQKTDWLPTPSCEVGVPCTVDYINWLGFITIPFLALVAFLIITIAMLGVWMLRDSATTDDGDTAIPAADVPHDRLIAVGISGLVIVLFFVLGKLY